MDADKIAARDFTYVQVIYSDPHASARFLVGVPTLGEARPRAEAFLKRERGRKLPDREPSKVYYYPRNYVREARALLAQGLADWLDPPDETPDHFVGNVAANIAGGRHLATTRAGASYSTLSDGHARGEARKALERAGIEEARIEVEANARLVRLDDPPGVAVEAWIYLMDGEEAPFETVAARLAP